MPTVYRLLLISTSLTGAAAFAAPAAPSSAQTLPTVIVRPRASTPAGRAEFQGESFSLEGDGEVRVSGLGQVLARSPSVAVPEVGAEVAAPAYSIRGLGPHQTRFRLGNIPWTEAEFHSSYTSEIPLLSLQTVQILPSGVPAAWGMDGLGAAVALEFPTEVRPSVVESRVGSFGFAQAGARAGLSARAPSEVGVQYTRSDEAFAFPGNAGTRLEVSDDRRETRSHNSFQRLSVLPRYVSESGQWEAVGFYAWQENQVPGSVLRQQRGQWNRNSLALGISRLPEATGGSFFADASYRRSTEGLQLQDAGAGLFVAPGTSLFQAVQARAGWQSHLAAGGAPSPAFSFGFLQHDYRRESVGLGVANTGKKAALPFSTLLCQEFSWPSAKLTVNYGSAGQITYYESNRTAPSLEARLSPRLSTVLLLGEKTRLRAAVGQYFRTPSLGEKFGTPSGVAASPQLVPERARKGEVGADIKFGFVNVSALSSLAYVDHEIHWVPTSQNSVTARNITASRNFYNELAVVAPLPAGFTAEVSGVYLQSLNFTEGTVQYGKDLPLRPRLSGSAVVRFARKRWTAQYAVRARGNSFLDFSNSTALGAQALHDLVLGFDGGSVGVFQLEFLNFLNAQTVRAELGGYSWQHELSGAAGFPTSGRKVYVSWALNI